MKKHQLRSKAWLLGFIGLFSTLAGQATAWEITSGDDLMEDSRYVAIGEVSKNSDILAYQSLSFKCWENQADATFMLFSTSTAWDNSARYEQQLPAKLRVDKLEPIDVMLRPVDVNGKFGAAVAVSEDGNVLRIMRQLSDAKLRLAMSFGGMAMEFSANQSTRAVKKMVETCSLNLPEQ